MTCHSRKARVSKKTGDGSGSEKGHSTHHLHRFDSLTARSAHNNVLALTLCRRNLDGTTRLAQNTVCDRRSDEEAVLALRKRERDRSDGGALL